LIHEEAFAIVCVLAVWCFIANTMWLLWGLYCNEKTGQDRIRLIDLIFDSPDFTTVEAANATMQRNIRLQKDYNSVTYAEHLRMYERLLNPIEAYPQSIKDLWEKDKLGVDKL